MTTTIEEPTSHASGEIGLPGYQLRLPGFEGPLDVLLRLIERNQLPITEVSLVTVTDQFLAYIAELETAPPEVIAEFAAVGARLTLLKSRSLLPKPPDVTEEVDPGDLLRQLVEYRALRDAARLLAERESEDVGMYVRPSEGDHAVGHAVTTRLATYTPQVLVRSIRRRLSLVPKPQAVLDAPPVVTLRDMIERMIIGLRARRRVQFSSIVAECRERREVQTAFLALLVLVRRRQVDAEQPELFGDISFTSVSPDGLSEFMQGLSGDAALGLGVDDE